MDDETRVLVAYATAAGSTEGIAERIAATLRDAGGDVTCRPAGPDVDPAAFDVLVVGSAVHNMAWVQPALDFLRRIPAEGNGRTWCFSVGGIAPHGPVTRRMTSGEARKLEQGFPPGFRPREHRFFGGVVEMRGLPLWGKAFWRLMGGRPGDHRDWPAIEAWARQIAAGPPSRSGVDGPGPGGSRALRPPSPPA